MSFIRIVDPKNPIEVYNKLNNEEFNFDLCVDILSSTNSPFIVRKVLENIEKLDDKEQEAYMDIVISLFDLRKQSDKIKEKAMKLAKKWGKEEELNKIIKDSDGKGYPSLPVMRVFKITKSDKYAKKTRDGQVVYDFRDVDFSNYDLVMVGEKINEDIILRENNTLRGVIDMSGAERFSFSSCDLGNVDYIHCDEFSYGSFTSAKNLPKNLEVKKFRKIYMNECDVDGIEMDFMDRAVVELYNAKNVSKNINAKNCLKINLSGIDLSEYELCFERRAARIHLNGTTLKAKKIEFPPRSIIELNEADMKNVDELVVGEDCHIRMLRAVKTPKKIDLSRARDIKLWDADFSNTEVIIFKNSGQKAKSDLVLPDNWKGQIIYTDDPLSQFMIRQSDSR